jgi:hypothetical protein
VIRQSVSLLLKLVATNRPDPFAHLIVCRVGFVEGPEFVERGVDAVVGGVGVKIQFRPLVVQSAQRRRSDVGVDDCGVVEFSQSTTATDNYWRIFEKI